MIKISKQVHFFPTNLFKKLNLISKVKFKAYFTVTCPLCDNNSDTFTVQPTLLTGLFSQIDKEICTYIFFLEKNIFLTFPACFQIPIIFSNLNSNCPNLLDLKNLQEQVKKAFCYQKLF